MPLAMIISAGGFGTYAGKGSYRFVASPAHLNDHATKALSGSQSSGLSGSQSSGLSGLIRQGGVWRSRWNVMQQSCPDPDDERSERVVDSV